MSLIFLSITVEQEVIDRYDIETISPDTNTLTDEILEVPNGITSVLSIYTQTRQFTWATDASGYYTFANDLPQILSEPVESTAFNGTY